MFLARVCFCLCFIGIIPGPELICRLFYFSFVFFWHNYCWLFVVAMFAHIWQAFHFYRLGEFLGIVGSCLLLLGCMHDICGAWNMFCVIISRFADFLAKRVRTWCAGKFPGHQAPQIIHAYAPPCPSCLILSSVCTIVPVYIDACSYILICTHIYHHILIHMCSK